MTNHQETRTELVEHLAELRARLIRAIIYIAIGMVIAWFLYDWLFAFLTRPMADVLAKRGSKFLLTGFPGAFIIQMQVCMVCGVDPDVAAGVDGSVGIHLPGTDPS